MSLPLTSEGQRHIDRTIRQLMPYQHGSKIKTFVIDTVAMSVLAAEYPSILKPIYHSPYTKYRAMGYRQTERNNDGL